MKLKTKTSNKLSTKLIGFLPFLKASLDEVYEELRKISNENPFIEVKEKRFINYTNLKNAITEKIEILTIYKEDFYEYLINEINSSRFFPTEKSKKIALTIIKDISKEGFFEGDEKEIADMLKVSIEEVKKVRERFKYVFNNGIGAKDIKEAFLFQLDNLEIENDLYDLVKEMINNLENLDSFKDRRNFKKALKIIKNFKFIPSIEYIEDEEIIPEIIITNKNGNLEISLNEEYYPEIIIDNTAFDKTKLKEARSLVDALEMRKATLKKIALMIVEFQYDFFKGGVIKPMKITDIANELEFAPSTISRAIANKYLLCNRGIIPLKSFFSTAITEDISSSLIKEEIKKIIENESEPLSDEKICNIINEKFNINLKRRTITKYREQLNIPSSRKRKKMYKV